MTPEIIDAVFRGLAIYGLAPVAGLMALYFVGMAMLNKTAVCPRCGLSKK
jgi:hypothetical protein